MHYFMSTEKQPEILQQLADKHGIRSPWSPAYFLNTRAPILKIQGFWYRADIVCGTNNIHSMNAIYDTIQKIPKDCAKWQNVVILRTETPLEVLEKIRNLEDKGYLIRYDVEKPETFIPIRKENFESSIVYETVKPWLAENQDFPSFIKKTLKS